MTRLSLRIVSALRLLAKRLLASYAYDKFKNFIAAKYGMLREAGGLVNGDVGKGGYVAHHFNSPTHLIENGLEPTTYENYKAALNGASADPQLRRLLEAEIAHIVFLPTWFHNYLHDNKIPPFRSRREYYDTLRLVLESAESYEAIKALRFNGGSIAEALKSIRNLAAAIPDQGNAELLEDLRQLYDKTKDAAIDALLHPRRRQ